MGLFSLKGRTGFLGRARRSLAELQDLGGTAATAGLDTLGRLTRTTVETEATRVFLVPRDQVGAVLQHLQPAEIAARFPFHGSAPGVVATCFDKKNALRLVELLLGQKPGSAKTIGTLEESAVAEMTNIALNGAITAVARDGLRFETGVPEVIYGVKDLSAFLTFDGAPEIDHAVVVETPFVEPSRDVRGSMILVFGIQRLDEP